MISKQNLCDAIIQECKACQALFSRIPVDKYGYRISENQRSIKELLEYLSFLAVGFAQAFVDGHFDWWQNQEPLKNVSDFPEAMDRQIEMIRKIFSEISDEDFTSKKVEGMPWGKAQETLGLELLKHCYGFILGYRMQLFLTAKASGLEKLSTGECWFSYMGLSAE